LAITVAPDDDPDAEDDEVLMLRVAAGDHPAFRALAKRHFHRTLALAERMMGRRADAEEIAQETFLRIWRHAGRWRPSLGKLETWLYRVTVNLCLDRLRRPKDLHLDVVEEAEDPTVDTERHVAAQEVSRRVAAAVAELPGRQRAALVLCYHQELTNAQAAEILAISVWALEALLVRARRTLRVKLKTLGEDLGEAR
jgi:RNA polymerase sigma-70 factor (ECF subfamily)